MIKSVIPIGLLDSFFLFNVMFLVYIQFDQDTFMHGLAWINGLRMEYISINF